MFVARPRPWQDGRLSLALGLCSTSLKRLLGFLAILIITALVVYQIRCNDDIFVTQPYESVDLITACTSAVGAEIGNAQIPNTIHQIWKDENIETYPIEPSVGKWKALFDPFNYTVKLWTERDVVRLIETSYPWLLSTYQGYEQNIQRADIARLAVIHAEGGIYADLDLYPTSVDHLQCVQQQLDYEAILVPTYGNEAVSNHFFMAERGSEFLLWALHEAKRRAGPTSKRLPLPYLQVFWTTGPLMITSAVRDYSWSYNYTNGKRKLGVLDENFLRGFVHHAAGRSWHGPDGRFLNYVSEHTETMKKGIVFVIFCAAVAAVCAVLRRRVRQPEHGVIQLSAIDRRW